MSLGLGILATVLGGVAAFFAFLCFLRTRGKPSGDRITPNELSQLLRDQSDRIRQLEEEQGRALRQELGDNFRGSQETALKVFREFGDTLRTDLRGFGDRLDKGVKAIDDRATNIGTKLDQDMARMGDEASRNRDALRQVVEGKLDDAEIRQATAAKGLREEMVGNFLNFREALAAEVKDFGDRLDKGLQRVDDRAAAIGTKLDQDMKRMGDEATRNRDALRQTVEGKLDDVTAKQANAAQGLRQEITDSFRKLGGTVSDTLTDLGQHQKERLENVTAALSSLSEQHERSQDALKQTVEGRLDAIRSESAAKLEEMRKTVDEKLQSTLETRLGESFERVVEQLERVHKGIGEMQSLAAGVGDLKRVLSNVRARGTFGEAQLGILLEQFLSPEQFTRNAQIKDGSQERVEFAIRLPGRDSAAEVLLPVDAKFPQQDYERLIAAADEGDAEAVAVAAKELESRIRQCAKTIKEKYIDPPRTTEFGILFLPTESLYAEVLRRPGFFEQLQLEYHVTLTGPTTFTALLNALQMGFRSLTIQKRSSEVWQVLGAVRAEFGKYNAVVDVLSKQLNTAAKSVTNLGVRTRAMSKRLRDVEQLPEDRAQAILGPAFAEMEDADKEAAVESHPVGVD